MGYALFAQRKLVLTGQINYVSLQQTQRSNEQYILASNTLSLQQQLTSMQSSQALQLSRYYEELANVGSEYEDQEITDEIEEEMERDRESINAKIKEMETKFEAELDAINRKIYIVGIKEKAIEMQVKNLDTKLSALQKQLEAVEEAEGSAIDRATPKFNGVG